ncbi:MAG: hypothetical protein D6717_12900 [Gammaproteobacteria bacterium]|nr:MAG: hypothetical protein D6717_12900 [Gammaproteobacteria bacterium]
MSRILLTIAALMAIAPAVPADILKIDDGKPVVVVLDNRPQRGMTMDQVRERFGEPAESRGPVGDPPITTWNYGDFIVVFEGKYVLHTVNKSAKTP